MEATKIKINRVFVQKRNHPARGTGLIAKAEIVTNSLKQIIHSKGVWEVESSADKEYLDSLVKAELQSLGATLSALGIGSRAIEYAIGRWSGEIISK